MNATAIGPLVFANDRLHAVLALVAFLLVLEFLAWRRPGHAPAMHRWGLTVAAVWIFAARLGYVVSNREVFLTDPPSALMLWQGGFEPAAGLAGLGLVGMVAILKRPEVLRPLVIAVVSAGAAYSTAELMFPVEARGQLPKMALPDLDGAPAQLADAAGRPVILNLWATWCPPCRREMPMMMQLAERQDDAVLRFANQGETPTIVRRYLDSQNLPATRVLLDRDQVLMERYGLLGLPSTLFFDASGRLVYVHTGEISQAELTNRINDLGESR